MLHQHFDGDHVDIARLQPSDIRRFLTHELIARHTPSHAHSVTGGLRVSEAIHLRDADVDLKRSLLTVRESTFGKSRQAPLHPSTVEALTRFRKRRRREIPTTPDPAFFTGSRGSLPGQPLGDRQVHRVFDQLRAQLHWANRGAHAAPRLHDLRHHADNQIMPNRAAGDRPVALWRCLQSA